MRRRGHRKMWWVVPCTSRKCLRTESQMDIEEILNAKLATINEEPEFYELAENGTPLNQRRKHKKGKNIRSKIKMRRYFMPRFSLKGSYALFMTGFASKGSLVGLLRY